MQEMSSCQKIRFEHINYLRGIAALLVAIYHLPYCHDFLMEQIVDLGKIGVVIFFSISGFLIPSTVRRTEKNWLAIFVRKRFFRLYPVYWISLVVALACMPMPTPTIKATLANISMLSGLLGYDYFINVYWTLQIEIIFYVLVIALTLRIDNQNSRVYFIVSFAFLIVALISSVLRNLTGQMYPVGIPLALSIMFWAHIWRLFVHNRDEDSKRYSFVWVVLFVFLMPLIARYGFGVQHHWYTENYLQYLNAYYMGISVFIIVTLFVRVAVGRLSVIGEASYSIYLFHLPVYSVISSIYVGYAFNGVLGVLLNFVAPVFVVVVLSILMYFLIEKPSIVLGRSCGK